MEEECKVIKWAGDIVAVYYVQPRYRITFKTTSDIRLTDEAIEVLKQKFDEMMKDGEIEGYHVLPTTIMVDYASETAVPRIRAAVQFALENILLKTADY